MNKRKKIGFALIGIGLIVALSFMLALIIKDFNPLNVDKALQDLLYNIRGEKYGAIFWVFRILTELGFVYVILFVLLIFMIFTKFDFRCIVIGFGTLFTLLLNLFIKACFLRERPAESLRWMEELSSSFPSSHSMVSTFFYGMMGYYVMDSRKISIKVKIFLFISTILAIPTIMLSRMVLGVHYFSDVMSGFGFGLACVGIGIFFAIIFEKKGYRFIRGLFERREKKTES